MENVNLPLRDKGMTFQLYVEWISHPITKIVLEELKNAETLHGMSSMEQLTQGNQAKATIGAAYARAYFELRIFWEEELRTLLEKEKELLKEGNDAIN